MVISAPYSSIYGGGFPQKIFIIADCMAHTTYISIYVFKWSTGKTHFSYPE
jgi:hypothetical protein